MGDRATVPLPPSTPDNDRDARRLLDSIPDAVLHVDAAGQVLVANTTANSLGRDGAPIVGQSVVHAFGQSFGASLLQLCRRVTVGTEAAAADLLHAETGVSWSARASPCDDGFCLILRRLGDSALPTANKRPTITERQLEALFDYAPVGFVYMDREGRYVRINQWMADMNGLPREEHIGRRIADVLPDIAPHAMPAITQIFETGKAPPPFEIHAETLYPSGAKRDFRVGWFPVTDMDGQVMYAGAVATEITELRRAEQESERLAIDLNRERRLLRAIIEQMPAGVIVAEAPTEISSSITARRNAYWSAPLLLAKNCGTTAATAVCMRTAPPLLPMNIPWSVRLSLEKRRR